MPARRSSLAAASDIHAGGGVVNLTLFFLFFMSICGHCAICTHAQSSILVDDCALWIMDAVKPEYRKSLVLCDFCQACFEHREAH